MIDQILTIGSWFFAVLTVWFALEFAFALAIEMTFRKEGLDMEALSFERKGVLLITKVKFENGFCEVTGPIAYTWFKIRWSLRKSDVPTSY